MTPERWQRLQALFNAAVELTPEQQAAFLDQACADDLTLRRQAESLLRCARQYCGPARLNARAGIAG